MNSCRLEVASFCSHRCIRGMHRLLCVELMKLVNRISQILSAIESARPRCSSGVEALCSLRIAIEKANILIVYCSEASKLYLAFVGEKILLRCEKIRNAMESCLTQLQNMVSSILAAQISSVLDDLRIATFTLESSEDEARKALCHLLLQDIAASTSVNMEELKALRVAALQLQLTSSVNLLTEKRSIKKQLEKMNEKYSIEKKILNYLLYLLRKYGKSIVGQHRERVIVKNEQSFSVPVDPYLPLGLPREGSPVDILDTIEPPAELKCRLSAGLMFDPVIIASGQTFERLCIEKWFNEGHETCPKTHAKLCDFSMTSNSAIRDLTSKWCMAHGIIVPDPYSQPTSVLPLRKISPSSSFVSFGSSAKGLNLQISNVSFKSSDTNSALVPLETNVKNNFCFNIPQNSEEVNKWQFFGNNTHGIDLSFLTKLAVLPWVSQCKAVEDVKNQLRDTQSCHSMMSTSYIKPLLRFLKNAHNLCDLRALKNGAQLLLIFFNEFRNEMPPFLKDAVYVISPFVESEIAEEALAILEMLSSQQSYMSEFVASGILPSILRVLESRISKLHLPAMKILCRLSENTDMGHHIIYLNYIPKLVPLLDDQSLAGCCIRILRNLCNIVEGEIATAESDANITSFAEILETGSEEVQELALDVLLSMCYQQRELYKLVIKENLISTLVHMSVNGKTRGKLIAMELLQLLNGDVDTKEDLVPDTDNVDISKAPAEKKRSSKASRLLRMKMFFGKRQE